MNRKAMRQAATASLGAFGILAAALFAAQAPDPKLPGNGTAPAATAFASATGRCG